MAKLKPGLETSTDYVHPYRPLPVRVFNLIGRAGGSLGWSSTLKVEALVDHATRKTGLSDFGDDGHRQALEVLVKSINDEAQLTPTGRVIQKARLAGALVHRLRIQELLGKHPEIHDVDLGSVILVTGLQRTGTTLLHRLLFSNPQIRGVTGGEALEPVPAGDVKKDGAAVRKAKALRAQRVVSYLSPQFNTVHPIDPDEPEEDVMLLDLSFMSQTPEATMHVPTYSRWLEDQDHTPAYEYFRKVLKILCWQSPGRRWVLKTPHHMEYLDVFLKVFPDAVIVQTHRDPRKAFPSFCSMVAHGRAIFSDAIDPPEIARHWSRKARRMVETAMRTRERLHPDQCMDVSYYDLVSRPVVELRRIARQAGIGFDDEAVRAAERYIEAHPQDRFGRHAYRSMDFGLTDEAIDELFSFYREKHAIPFE